MFVLLGVGLPREGYHVRQERLQGAFAPFAQQASPLPLDLTNLLRFPDLPVLHVKVGSCALFFVSLAGLIRLVRYLALDATRTSSSSSTLHLPPSPSNSLLALADCTVPVASLQDEEEPAKGSMDQVVPKGVGQGDDHRPSFPPSSLATLPLLSAANPPLLLPLAGLDVRVPEATKRSCAVRPRPRPDDGQGHQAGFRDSTEARAGVLEEPVRSPHSTLHSSSTRD